MTVLTLAFSAQADMMRMHSGTLRQIKNNKVAEAALTQSQAEKLQAPQTNGPRKVITTLPEGELRTYQRVQGQGVFPDQGNLGLDVQSGKMDMVFADDNVVYMKNILFNCNLTYGSSWVQGTLSDDGTTITVPMGQPIFEDPFDNTELVLCMGRTELVYVYDGEPSISFTVDENVAEVTYVIDGDNIALQGTDGSDATGQDMNRWNAYGLACCWADDGSFGGCLEWSTLLTRTETSVIPTVIYDQPEGEMVTYNRAGMSIFTGYFGVQSSPFTDYDEIFTFKAEDFPNDLTEDITEVPSSVFYSSWDLSYYGAYLYYDEAPLFDYRVGIQVHYTINGVRNSSNIVYWGEPIPIPDPSGVSELSDGKQIADVRYYNLAGQQVAQPRGLTIQVTTYSDGTRTATKVIK